MNSSDPNNHAGPVCEREDSKATTKLLLILREQGKANSFSEGKENQTEKQIGSRSSTAIGMVKPTLENFFFSTDSCSSSAWSQSWWRDDRWKYHRWHDDSWQAHQRYSVSELRFFLTSFSLAENSDSLVSDGVCRQNTSSHAHFSVLSVSPAHRTVFCFHTHVCGSRTNWAQVCYLLSGKTSPSSRHIIPWCSTYFIIILFDISTDLDTISRDANWNQDTTMRYIAVGRTVWSSGRHHSIQSWWRWRHGKSKWREHQEPVRLGGTGPRCSTTQTWTTARREFQTQALRNNESLTLAKRVRTPSSANLSDRLSRNNHTSGSSLHPSGDRHQTGDKFQWY